MAKIKASVSNRREAHEVHLQTNDHIHAIEIPPKAEGFGSSASGGELLFLALATCYCNDIYREAAKRGIKVERVEVEVEGEGDFEREGGPATNVTYHARVKAGASREDILDLMRHTDQVAEIQNTLRSLTPVSLASCEVIEQG
jgi:uncharacterized OsmC-like protein